MADEDKIQDEALLSEEEEYLEEDFVDDFEEDEESSDPDVKPKSQLQLAKERLYDKVPLTVKQLDIIIRLCIVGWVVLAIVIALDAIGVF